jgi:hypothetical protein
VFFTRLAAGAPYYELSRLIGAASERDASDDFLDALELRFRDALIAGPGEAGSGLARETLLRLFDCLADTERGIGGGLNVKYAHKRMILNMLGEI